MSNDQTEYELFISYARLDNKPIPDNYPHGWVTALRDQIVADQRRYSTERLRIFFDTDEIKDMDDWRHRILGGLRSSKILLVCLSPNYFKSQPCQWEWEEYHRRQTHQLIGTDSVATVYFIEVPGSDEQENAKRLAELMRGNFTDLRPWFPAGPRMIQEEEVKRRIDALGLSLYERIERARRARSVPGNVRRTNPFFVGRREELRRLHEQLGVGSIGVVTAVHGLGGQGKTELAYHYANGYADCYSAGLWSLGAEGKKELLPLLGELAFLPQFGYTPSDPEKADANRLGQAVLVELQKRCANLSEPERQRGAALIILDNVSEPELLSAAQLAALPHPANWLRLAATTRLGPERLAMSGKQLATVAVDSLNEDDALILIRDHQPDQSFPSAAEETAAREIARELGGFTLAIEQAAVHLGLNAEHELPSAFLKRLRAEGLPSVDDLPKDADVAAQILHQQKQLGPILRATLEPLVNELPAAKTALQFAALLPPDSVPWRWLRALTHRHHPELGETMMGWDKIKRRLEGMRLLTGGNTPQIARMHRLLAAHIRTQIPAHEFIGIRRVLNMFVSEIVISFARIATEQMRMELNACAAFAIDTKEDWVDALLAPNLCRPLAMWGFLEQGVELAKRASGRWRKAHETDHDSAIPLVESLLALGDFEFRLGHFNEATQSYAQGLEVMESEGKRVEQYWRHAWCAARCHQRLADQWFHLRTYEPAEERNQMLDLHLNEAQRLASFSITIADRSDTNEMEVEYARLRASDALLEISCTRAEWSLEQKRYDDAVMACGTAVRSTFEGLPSLRQKEPLCGNLAGIGLILIRVLFERPDLASSIEVHALLLNGMAEKELREFGNVPAILISLIVSVRLSELVSTFLGSVSAAEEKHGTVLRLLPTLGSVTSGEYARTLCTMLRID